MRLLHTAGSGCLAVLLAATIISCGPSSPAPVPGPPDPPADPLGEPTGPTTGTETGGGDTPAEPVEPAEPTEPTGQAAPIKWSEMDDKARGEHMKKVVMPAMKKIFTEFDDGRYAKMDCATCHGEGAKKGEFEMPNPKLPKLDVADQFKAHMQKSPEVTKFMMAKVVPEMARVLDMPTYDPKTHEGLGCLACHEKK